MTRKTLAFSLAATLVGALNITPALAQSARDSINIVGSSTVYPFTATVAEQFGRGGKFKTPKVESTGTGGGIKLFCNGVGPQFPDVANASRRIKSSELATCAQNGVKDVVEIKVGYDGIVLAENKSGASLNLTRKDVYLALAKTVPDPANPGTLIANPYLSSLGVVGGIVDDRFRALPSIDYRRVGSTFEIGWRYPDLASWASAELGDQA